MLGHLPKPKRSVIRMRLRAAWKMNSYEEAKKELRSLVRHLDTVNSSAARSVEEGLEETITLHRLKVPDQLRRALRTTNQIENAFSTTRERCRNVKRWRKGDMAARWAGTMLIDAQKRFMKIRGRKAIPNLMAALGRNVKSEEHAA